MSNGTRSIASVADIRPRFTKTVEWLASCCSVAADALRNKRQYAVPQLDKNGWSGSPFDVDDSGKPFDRSEHDADMRKVIGDASTGGVVGDLQLITFQGDYLATLERATRIRQTTRCRAIAHVAGRRRGHGHDGGLFKRGVIGYVSRLAKLSKEGGNVV